MIALAYDKSIAGKARRTFCFAPLEFAEEPTMIDAKRFLLTCILAAPAGCSALPLSLSQDHSNALAVTPAMPYAEHSQSYMFPEAKSSDLLYVSEKQPEDVQVFTYPRGKLVGTLTGFSALNFLCSDKSGNVWIPDAGSNTIVEYAHGGTQPIATLHIQSSVGAEACSVDPSTGDLAIAGNSDSFAVYKHAEGKPRIHRVTFGVYGVAYDNHANLFVDGREYGNPFVLGELPAGKRHFRTLLVDPHLDYFDQVQWDGQYVDVSVYEFIYRYSIVGKKAAFAGSIILGVPKYIGGFWIHGPKVVATDWFGYGPYPTAEIFKFPAGGNPAKTISGTGGWGVTVSVAPSSRHRR
jgi:hypothetical protein